MLKQKVDGYQDLSDVISEVHDSVIFNLRDIADTIPKKHQVKLKSNPNGIYVPGFVDPSLNFEQFSYIDGTYLDHIKQNARLIKNHSDFLQAHSDIVTSLSADEGIYVTHRTIPRHLRHSFTATSPLPYAAIHLSAIEIFEQFAAMLNDVHQQLFTNMSTFAQERDNFIRQEYSDSGFCVALPAKAVKAIHTLVGRDRFATYHVRRSNATLFVEKGNDIRLIEYYRARFEERDAIEAVVDPVLSVTNFKNTKIRKH